MTGFNSCDANKQKQKTTQSPAVVAATKTTKRTHPKQLLLLQILKNLVLNTAVAAVIIREPTDILAKYKLFYYILIIHK